MRKTHIAKRRISFVFTLGIIIISFISGNIVLMVSAQSSGNQTIQVSGKINSLNNIFLKETESSSIKKTNGGIQGKGYSSSGIIEGDNYFLKENSIAVAALMQNHRIQGTQSSLNWAKNDLYTAISQLKGNNSKYLYSKETDRELDIYFAQDQFIFIEFICEAIDRDSSGFKDFYYDTLSTIEGIDIFEAQSNATVYNNASQGVYWTGTAFGSKITNAEMSESYSKNNPYPGKYDYPLTQTSLWAAASLAHFAAQANKYIQSKEVLIEEDALDESLNDVQQIINLAQNALSYAKNYAWDSEEELYYNYPSEELSESSFNVVTQLLAILANVRLYEATQERMYLTNADILIDNVLTKFGDVGLGGLVRSYNSSSNERIANGIQYSYDNQLFVYILSQIAEATGSNTKNFADFWEFERAKNEYVSLAIAEMKFLNSYMWQELALGDNTFYGYVKSVNASTGSIIGNSLQIDSNMLGLYNLNLIEIAQVPFVEFYQQYIYIMVISAIVIIIAAFIIRRGGIWSSKLSKDVRGLL